jgi:hypothetical protein
LDEPEPHLSLADLLQSSRNVGAQRRPVIGYCLTLTAYILIVAVLVIVLFGISLILSEGGAGIAGIQWIAVVLAGLFWALLKMFQEGKRLLIRSAQETIARDPRPYVLYLRAFNADVCGSYIPEFGEMQGLSLRALLVGFVWKFFRFLSPRPLFAPPLTEEEQIVRALTDIGPVIAVGAPDEGRTPLGASRLYLHGEQWETQVTQLVRSAGAVVIRISENSRVAPQSMLGVGAGPGLTQGLKWEVTAVPLHVRPDQLLFLVSAGDEGYGNFYSAAHHAFPHGLPSSCSGEDRAGRVRALIGFDDDWEPHLFPLCRWDTSSFRFARYPFTTAIREKLVALRRNRPPRSPWLSLAAGIVATLLSIFLLAFVGSLSRGPFVPASQMMVMIPPSAVAVPLLSARVPSIGVPGTVPGLVAQANVSVRVTIGITGAVQHVVAQTQNANAAGFVQNTVRNWRFQPVLRNGRPIQASTIFVYPLRVVSTGRAPPPRSPQPPRSSR